MDDRSSDDESVVTNTTVDSAGCSPRQLFKGLNMLRVNTQEMENLISDGRSCSPVIPSQIVTAPILTSQLTEPLFSDLTDEESTCSQSLFITDTTNHSNQTRVIRSETKELRCQISQENPQQAGFNQRTEREILSSHSLLPLLRDQTDMVAVCKSALSVREVEDSLTDSDATRLETDLEVSPSPNGKSCRPDAEFGTQVNYVPGTTRHAGEDFPHSAQCNDTQDVGFSQMSAMTFTFPEFELNQQFKDDAKRKSGNQDKLHSGLDEHNSINNRTADCRKTCIARDSSFTSKSFVPPFKKMCRSTNQKIQDMKVSNDCPQKLPEQQHRMWNNSSLNTDDVNKNVPSDNDYSTAFQPSSNCQTFDNDLNKVSQVMTSMLSNINDSQVSTMSSKSLFSSSVPSESESSKPCDHVTDAGKALTSERGDLELGDRNDRMCWSVHETMAKDKYTDISQSSAVNGKPEQLENDELKGCMVSVSDNTDLGQMSQPFSDNKNTSGESSDVSDPQKLKKCSDSSSSIDTFYNRARPDIKPTIDVKSTKLKGSPFTTKDSNFKGSIEGRSEVPFSLLIRSQGNLSAEVSHLMEPTTESPFDFNENNCISSVTEKPFCSTSIKKTLLTHERIGDQSQTCFSSSSSITKSPQSKRSLTSVTESKKKSNGRKNIHTLDERGASEEKCMSSFTTARGPPEQGTDKYYAEAESEDKACDKSRCQSQKLNRMTSDKSVVLPDQSEKKLLSEMTAQYTEMAEQLENRNPDKKIFESITQRIKGLQVKILKLSECHKHERADMMVKIQKGVMSKFEKLQLKSVMQDLAERQKHLIEIVKNHKDINTKLKSLSVEALSGPSTSFSQEKRSTLSSDQVPTSSQASKSSILQDQIKVKNISGDKNTRTSDVGVMVGETNLPSSDEKLMRHLKQVDYSSKTDTLEVTAQKNDSTSTGSLRAYSNATKKSTTPRKNVVDLIDDAVWSSTLNKLPHTSVPSSVHDDCVSRTFTYSTANSDGLEKLVEESLKTSSPEDHAEKLQSKMAAKQSVKEQEELPSKVSLNENSQKLLDDIFFTNRTEPHHHDNTEVKVSSKLEDNFAGSQVIAGQRLNGTCSGTEVNTGNKLSSMTYGRQVNVKADCNEKPGTQVNIVNKLTSMTQARQVNAGTDCNAEYFVAAAEQTCKDVQSEPSNNKSQGVPKTQNQVIVDVSEQLEQTCKRQIEQPSISVQLKRTKIEDKNGTILDVFVIQDPRSSSTCNTTTVEMQAKPDISKSQNENVETKAADFDARETTEISTDGILSEVKLKNSVNISSNKTVGHDAEQNQYSKNNTQSNCSPSLVISPVCHKPSVFKSPEQIVPTSEASTTVSPCSTAVSSDVFPVTCTELARRMKARATNQSRAPCLTQNRSTLKASHIAPAEKSLMPPDPVNFSAKSPCLKDLVCAGLVKPGRHVLHVNTKEGKIWADATNGGLIRGREGKIFRTPCAWMSAITGCVVKKKAPVYQQIHYLNKSLSELIRELAVTKKTMVDSTSPIAKSTQCATDRPVKTSSSKENQSDVPSPSNRVDNVMTALLQTLDKCKVKLIDDAEIVHCPELTPSFWSSDFAKVKMSKDMWASVDCWR
ncbi:uncharacterized protein LOC121368469 [Gigantopelta aegis]|uniref:uncharacterized protein LOC121368469 n=1 Tax=Gigantopelta aegis TaxID=1735272 RepID=UPI001B88DBA2|nr:uncharacterized protein LOC121368469 [Gigantopelta aegis]